MSAQSKKNSENNCKNDSRKQNRIISRPLHKADVAGVRSAVTLGAEIFLPLLYHNE